MLPKCFLSSIAAGDTVPNVECADWSPPEFAHDSVDLRIVDRMIESPLSPRRVGVEGRRGGLPVGDASAYAAMRRRARHGAMSQEQPPSPIIP